MLYYSQLLRTLLLPMLLCVSLTVSGQTTIINSANNTGTSGADGSFQNATNAFSNNGWTVVNGSTNKWFVGTQSFCAGTKGAYVGTATNNNNYTATTTDASHFYKDVTFPSGLTCITLSFSWKGQGESSFDGLRIYLGSTSVAPVGGTVYTTSDASAVQLGNSWYNLQASCGTATITIPASYAGTTKRLVFSWENDNSVGTNPGATVDAVSLIAQASTVPGCATGQSPANAATGIAPCTASLSWTAPTSTGCNTATSYDVYFGTSATPPLVTNTTSTSFTPTLAFGTTYYWKIVPKNSAGDATGCSTLSFTTTTTSNPQFNLVDDATSASPYNCVTLTPDLLSQRGCAWDANSTLNFLANFTYEMDINLGSNDAGADGMAFVIQNDPLGRCKCGTVGGNLGAGGITNSLTVEIDTYINYEDRDDFVSPLLGCSSTEEPDHLDIWFNGNINPDLDANCDAVASGERPVTANAVRLQSSPGVNYNIENGVNHKLRITWNASTSTLTASVLNTALTVTYGTISATFNPVTVFGTNAPYFGFTGSTGGLSNQQTFCLPAVLLPVTISEYEVYCSQNTGLIAWKTESEVNNAYYTLEKSCDGVKFEPFAKVPVNTNGSHTYALTDASPCRGVSYYKLSQTDNDGTTTVLGIRSVKSCNSDEDIMVAPNPAQDQFTVSWNNSDVAEIELLNALGQQVRVLTDDFDNKQVAIDVHGLSAGVYYLNVYSGNGMKTIKVKID